MKPVRSLFAALCCSLPLCVAHAATYGTADFADAEPVVGDDITIAAGTELKDLNKIGKPTETLIQVDAGGSLVVEPGLTVEKIIATEDGGLIYLGEGAEALISGPASINTVQSTGSGGVVYMAADSKLTLRTENAGERIEISGNEEEVPGDKIGQIGKGYPNDIYMEEGAELVAVTAAGSVIVLEGGLEAEGEATLTKTGAGTLAVGDTSFFDGSHIAVKDGNLLVLQDSLWACDVAVDSDAAITFNVRESSVYADSFVLDGTLHLIYSPLWEEGVGTAALTLSSADITVGETAGIALTLTEDVLNTIAEGGSFSAWLVDTSGMDASTAGAVQLLLAHMTVLNEQGDEVKGMVVTADKGRVMITPEPATATLSLLALSALCLRRRRAANNK